MQRTTEADHLRSAALGGIALVNMPFIAAPLLAGPPRFGLADLVAEFAIAWLCAAKFFLLFAFLFGWTFGILQRSAERDDRSFASRFRRRTAGLFAIGLLHASLVFPGDILIPYALIGVVLFAVRGWSDGALLRLAWATVPLAALVLAGLALLLPETPPAVPLSGYLGSAGDVLRQRWADWRVALPFILLFNGPLVLGAFCLGLVAQRRDFLAPGNPFYARLRRRLLPLWLVGLALNLPFAAAATGLLTGVPALAASVLLAVAAPVLSAAYLVSVVEFSRAGRFPRSFGAAGRMSLTAYVAEGLLGGFVFVGLGLFGQVGMAGIVAIALTVYVVIEAICAGWMRHHAQGPLERVLRAVTYAGERVR